MAVNTHDNQHVWPASRSRTPLAVLCSGGIDSAILLAEALQHYPAVWPLYIRSGLKWEVVEIAYLLRFMDAVRTPALESLTLLDQPVADLYDAHWSMTGLGVPDEKTPDEAVYLPGRNVLLLAKALVWCHLHHVPEIAMAPLAANPFPDATREFFTAFAGAVSMGVDGHVLILRPYAHLTKTQLLSRAKDLPLQHTFSCIRPVDERHCGRCNKCAERQKAFSEAGLVDPTTYSNR
jgi:7-cyano-7-deazaguanine synthase